MTVQRHFIRFTASLSEEGHFGRLPLSRLMAPQSPNSVRFLRCR